METSKYEKQAIELADSIGSPYGEGATYHSIFETRPLSLDVEREPGNSHLSDGHWRVFVEDVVALISQAVQAERERMLKLVPKPINWNNAERLKFSVKPEDALTWELAYNTAIGEVGRALTEEGK